MRRILLPLYRYLELEAEFYGLVSLDLHIKLFIDVIDEFLGYADSERLNLVTSMPRYLRGS